MTATPSESRHIAPLRNTLQPKLVSGQLCLKALDKFIGEAV